MSRPGGRHAGNIHAVNVDLELPETHLCMDLQYDDLDGLKDYRDQIMTSISLPGERTHSRSESVP